MSDQRLSLKSALLVLLIILAGLPLRFDLAQRFYLDFDEAMYFQAASEPTLAAAWDASRAYTHPPLAFLMYHEWLNVGTSEWLLRLPSILLGGVATWLAYLWLTRLTDRRAAIVGVFFMTFALPVLHVSAQMRSYTLLFVFVFGALWFDERFRESQRWRHVAGECACLMLGLLTHYATAWLIGVLGVVGLVRASDWGLRSRATRGWVIAQCLLASACVALYLTHIRGFVGGTTQEELWAFWMHGNRFGDALSGRFLFAIFSTGRFFGSLFGFLWMPMLCASLAGVVLLARDQNNACRTGTPARRNEHESDGESRQDGQECPSYEVGVTFNRRLQRSLLVALPFLFAIVLQTLKVYPFGATRHSLWLLPFLLLAISAAVRPLLNRPTMIWRTSLIGVCLLWAWWCPVRFVSQCSTSLTPTLMQQTASKLKSLVPRDQLILTDEGTRNVLAYYLGRDAIEYGRDVDCERGIDRGREIAHGFREYRIDGFRFVTIPKFHFFMYSLRDDWKSFANSLGAESTQPMWLVYMGFEVAGNDLKSLGQRIPPATLLSQHAVGDNHFLRLQFREPTDSMSRTAIHQSFNRNAIGVRAGADVERAHADSVGVKQSVASSEAAQRTVVSDDQ